MEFLKSCGYDSDLLESLRCRDTQDKTMEEMISHFEALDSSFRTAASEDDERHG